MNLVMARKQVSATKRNKARLKVSKKLYNGLRKEAKRKDLSVTELSLQISERGIRKRKKSKG